MKQDPSRAFVNITGSVFVGITLIGTFLAFSFSNENKTKVISKGLDPETYWDQSSCRCLAEEEAEATSTVFLQAGFMPSELFSGRSLSK